MASYITQAGGLDNRKALPGFRQVKPFLTPLKAVFLAKNGKRGNDYGLCSVRLKTTMEETIRGEIPAQESIFGRNRPAIGKEEQEKLAASRVLVCGCGGLGGALLEQLARTGVGYLRMVDPDHFEPSNLNRQLGALQTTLGRNKARVMAERVVAINPFCQASPIAGDFRDTGCLDGMDVAVDCLDNGPARLELARRCEAAAVPLVHGAVRGWHGQAGIVLPGDTRYEKLYGQERQAREPISVLAPAVFAVAAIQAALVIKLLLARPCHLEKRWLHIDLLEDDYTCL